MVYQVQVDRFNNGNLTNDHINPALEQRLYSGTSYPHDMPRWRHGGDIAGIRDRLGYLQHLGVNAIWVTPLLQHDGEYHGYCTTNPTTIDPGFGTPEQFRDFVQEAHSRGIRVVLDIVINHLCDVTTTYSKKPAHLECTQALNHRYWAATKEEIPTQGTLDFGPTFFPPFRSQSFFNRCGSDTMEEMGAEGGATMFGDFTMGMFDFDTQNWDFQEIFTQLHKYWVAYADIDGFRLDAAKHVTKDFLAFFSTEMRAYAGKLGKKNFMVLGEVAATADWVAQALGRMETDPAHPWDRNATGVPQGVTRRIASIERDYQRHAAFPLPGLSSVYNFEQSGDGAGYLIGQHPAKKLADFYASSRYGLVVNQTLGQANLNSLWTLLECHDWPRMLTTMPHRPEVLIAGFGWLFTSPGIPIIYYGLEQGFNGNCGAGTIFGGALVAAEVAELCEEGDDAKKRQDMFVGGPWLLGSAVPEINKLARIDAAAIPALSPPWREDPFLRTDHQVYRTARLAAALRKSCAPLRSGSLVWRSAEGGANGNLLAYSRILPRFEVLVLINPGFTGAPFIEQLEMDSEVNQGVGTYVNALDPSQTGRTVWVGGRAVLVFTGGLMVDGGTFAVFVHQDRLGLWDKELGTALCKAG